MVNHMIIYYPVGKGSSDPYAVQLAREAAKRAEARRRAKQTSNM